MGNSKSRPAGTKSRGKHSKLPGSGRSSKQSHANQQQPLPNDSGHYSIHGFMASSSSPIDRPETPVGGGGPGSGTGLPGVVGSLPWNHPNMSSPGRLDQQEKTSDSSLHFQYSSKVKHGAAPNPATAGTNGHIHSHETSLRTSGLGSRATMVLGIGAGEEAAAHGYSNTNTIHNTPSSQEMMMSMHHQQPQPLYQGADPRPSSASPHQSHGRTSTFHPNHTQQQQQQQQQRPMQAPVPPSTVPFLEDENATENAPGGSLGGVVSSVAAMNLGDVIPMHNRINIIINCSNNNNSNRHNSSSSSSSSSSIKHNLV
ncbi:hypothetical protein BC939DRAFT_37646 [Gamsiella multidivaricata]|uniref:uncharacterized protein n=1 Tax=Gamsiella multidivaricata TaxID=101098 RepID=UPI00221ED357|nr:uncharacterized protein BC939DRAFT_37646 [Gamsiella multidivaricata]KAI7828908.1 hypothetical protein BC939DRAFT_37646 [Gamsiella multidivaricata]